MDSDDDVIGQSHGDTSLKLRHQQTGEVVRVSLAASRRLLRFVLVFIVVEAPAVDLIG